MAIDPEIENMAIDPESRWNYGPTVDFQFSGNHEPGFFDDSRSPDPNDYRLAAERLMRVFHAIDEIMIHSRNPWRDWRQISLALGLPSCRYFELTEAKIGRKFGISKMAVSKSITELLRLAELKPNGRGYNGRL
jgi:hypothetical protein